VIEHDMVLVTGIADRLVAMHQGRVIAEGAPAAVLSHAEVVASYLGVAPRPAAPRPRQRTARKATTAKPKAARRASRDVS
jgi:ABC-type hemin transport system ATPase subunit